MPRRSAYCHRDGVPGTNPNGSYLFTGTSTNGTSPFSNTTVSHGIGTGAYTRRCWFKPTEALNLNMGIWTFAQNGGDATSVGNTIFPKAISGGLPHLWTNSSGSTTVVFNQVGVVGMWYHIVETRDGSGHWKLYLQGVDVTNAVSTSSNNIPNNPIIIGARGNTDYVAPGYHSDVLLIQGTAWDAAEVLLDYTKRRDGSDGTILGTKKDHWPLDGKDSGGSFGSGSSLITNSDQGLRDTVGSFTLNIWGAPVWVEDSPFPPPTADAGGPYTACAETPTQLDGTATNDVSYLWTTDGDGTFDDDTLLDPTYTPGSGDVSDGTVTLTLTVTGYASQTAQDTATLEVGSGPSVSAGGPYSTTNRDPVDIEATATKYNDLLWETSGTGVFEDDESSVTTYTPSQADVDAGFVELTVTVSDDCGDGVSTTVLLIAQPEPDPFPPDGLTVSVEVEHRGTGIKRSYGYVPVQHEGSLRSWGRMTLTNALEDVPCGQITSFGLLQVSNRSATESVVIAPGIAGTEFVVVPPQPSPPATFRLVSTIAPKFWVDSDDDEATALVEYLLLEA